ncbi:hypothetical protein [Sinorhizobium fredii]|uniref:hypothetical protein n=1 Tax=Rhizobium fredii TaxID=380 RepID=UPI00351161E7
MAQDKLTNTSVYKHAQESVQRPDVGVEAQFSNKKAPRTYRYDSSLAPELSWDESAERAFAEWLLARRWCADMKPNAFRPLMLSVMPA